MNNNLLTIFSGLRVGSRFEFDRSGLPLAHSCMTGPWVKLSPRKYQHENSGLICRVGSVNVRVEMLPTPTL